MKNIKKIITRIVGRKSKPSRFMKQNSAYSKYEIGDYSYGYPIIKDWSDGGSLKIGRYCSIAANVTIFLGGNHRVDWISTYPFNVIFKEFNHIKGHPKSKGDVIIGNDVWIGNGCTILSGVTIGDGAVIAAKSVISKSVEPYSIVAGNPAKFVKWRFTEDTIRDLLSIRWWNWPFNKVKENIEYLTSPETVKFLKNHKS